MLNKRIVLLLVCVVIVILVIVVRVTLFQEIQTAIEPSHQDIDDGSWKEFWGNYSELGEGIVPYTCFPVDTQYVDEIIPMGHLRPPDHPIPTDHIYFVLNKTDLGAPEDGFSKPVKAPADGVIMKIVFRNTGGDPGYPDYSVYIRHTDTFLTAFLHLSEISPEILNATGPLKEGWDGNKVYVKVNAGDMIGKTSAGYGQSACLDMCAYDKNTSHFIHPEKHGLSSHAISPIDNFNEDLKNQLYQKVKRTKEPRGGKVDFDIKGKLVGIWLLEGTTGDSEDGSNNYLSFVYDVYDPQYLRVSLGMNLGGFLARVKGNGPDFKDIDINSGKVVYKLIPVKEGDEFFGESQQSESDIVTNTLLVQMVNEEKIKVEVFDGDVQNPSFTESAKFYTR